jgi:hypothetical protein
MGNLHICKRNESTVSSVKAFTALAIRSPKM